LKDAMNRELAKHDPSDATPAECRATLERLQSVLDGEAQADLLRNDLHPRTCGDCRERLQAARVFVKAMAPGTASNPTFAFPVEAILASVAEDRASRARSHRARTAVGMALAAGVMIALIFWPEAGPVAGPPQIVEKVKPVDSPAAVPPRMEDAFADAGEAIQGLGRMFSEPSLPSTELLAPFSRALGQPLPSPMATDFEPAASSLAALPEAALSSLEPLTGSATRVFTRFIQDVSAMPTTAAPKQKS